jgi:hypothetical protein
MNSIPSAVVMLFSSRPISLYNAEESLPGNLRLAFEATGFYPFNPARPPASPVDEGHPRGTFGNVVAQGRSATAQLLTDPKSLAERFAAELGRPLTSKDVT